MTGRRRTVVAAVVAAAVLAVAAPAAASDAAPMAVGAPAAAGQAAPELAQLSQAFSPMIAPMGGTATLTFTITNTADGAAKPGWSFDDTLPGELTVAADPATATTCANGVVDATAGGSAIHVAGDLDVGQSSCTASVDVTAPTAGVHGNPSSAFTNLVGVSAPADALAYFAGVVISETGPAAVGTGAQFTYHLRVTNITAGPLDGVVALEDLGPNLGYVSSSPAPAQRNGQQFEWVLGTLGAGQQATVDLTVTAPSTAQTVTNKGAADFSINCTPKPQCSPQVIFSRPVSTQVVASAGVPWVEPGALAGLAVVLVVAGYVAFRRRRRTSAIAA